MSSLYDHLAERGDVDWQEYEVWLDERDAMNETLCSKCDNCLPVGPPWRWECRKHPRLEGFGFVTPDKWDDMPPHLWCKDVNGGACPLFEPKRGTDDGH